MSEEKGRFIQNKYEIVSKIKQGGFGIVYYGYDHVFDKPIAIKAIEPSLLQEAKYIDSFLEEAKNAGKLSHNNIVHIYNLVRDDDGQFFIIMEYIHGVDLGKILRQCRQKGLAIPQELGVFVIKEICKALEYAHNKRDLITDKPLKLVHLDISPSNIMVSFSGHIKLIDFGLAKIRFQNNKSRDSVLTGKLPYMAPEQLNGGNIDRRTDIFALGALFYEILTGSRAFPIQNPEQTVELIRRAKIDETLLVKNKVPEQLQRILFKMSKKDPDDRYHGANGVYLDLVEYLMTTAHSVELSEELGDFIKNLFDYDAAVDSQSPPQFEPELPNNGQDEINALVEELQKVKIVDAPISAVEKSDFQGADADDIDEISNTISELTAQIEPTEEITKVEDVVEVITNDPGEQPTTADHSAEDFSEEAFERDDILPQEESFEINDMKWADSEQRSEDDIKILEEADNIQNSDAIIADESPIAVADAADDETMLPDEIPDLMSELEKVRKSINAGEEKSLAESGSPKTAPPHQIVQSIYSEEEGEDDLKTVIDVIRLSTKSNKKKFTTAGIAFLGFIMLFFIVDIFFQMTAMGEGVYNRLFPPAIRISTVPSGATVYLDQKRVSGVTPLSIPRIAPGVHELTLTYAGYSQLVKSVHVPSKGEVNISGEAARKGYDPYLFRFKSIVDLTSDPSGATIYINNTPYLHKTPSLIEWEVGMPLSIEMEQEGFQKISGFRLNTLDGIEEIEDRRIWSFQKFEGEEKRYRVEGAFKKIITVTSIPSGVVFFIDGAPNPSGQTDVSSTIALSMGKHEITFRKDGFNTQRVNVTVDKDGPESLSVVLTRNVRFFAIDKTDLGNNDIGATIVKIIQNNRQFVRNNKTPCEISLPPVDLQVVLSKNGYKDAIARVTARDKDIVVKMEPSTIEAEIVVMDALTGLPLKDVQISYRSLTSEQTSEMYYGSTDEQGRCGNKISPGEYSFKAKKFGYFEKYAILNTHSGENKLEFRLIIQ